MKSAHSETNRTNPLRDLPPVHRLLAAPEVSALAERLPTTVLTEAARAVLEAARADLLASDANVSRPAPSEQELARRVVAEARRRHSPSLQPAINATGVVLHTGLGRARLAESACSALFEVAQAHSMVEIDRETGRRGARRDHVRGLLRELTGAEDAAVVNNCAGAVFLVVTTLAQGREVIISRGELVEIGGAFRMPDIVRASGATLVEVGTTNRTRLSDYANAITDRTALILRCHPSNFAIVGFTEETPTADLVKLGKEYGIPVMDDQGSGALIDITGRKSTLRDSVQAGSSVITASGDKLLGGPQAGLILGDKTWIERIVKHPLARALRVDKFTLAALEATLRLYRDPAQAIQAIPTLRYLARQEPELRRMAAQLRARMRPVLAEDRFDITLISERSQVGGGSLPGEDLPTICVALRARDGSPGPDEIAARLRHHDPPVFARIKDDAVLFDPRTLERAETAIVAEAVKGILK